MTDATPESAISEDAVLAEWRAAMEGVTPGPWNPSRFGMQVLTGDSWSTVCTFHNNNGKDGKWNDHRLAAWEDGRGADLETSNADWVARCSPARVGSLLALIDDLRARLAAAEGALAKIEKVKQYIAVSDATDPFAAMVDECEAAEALATTATARVAELEGVLKPFAEAAQSFEEWRDEFGLLAEYKPGHHVVYVARWPDKDPAFEQQRRITVGDFRRARALTGDSND